MKGKLKKIKGRQVLLELDEDVELSHIERDIYGFALADVEFYDDRYITPQQRNHFWALMGDYWEYTGSPIEASAQYFKYQFMIDKQLADFPSVGTRGMSRNLASELLEFIILKFIKDGVLFRKENYYLSMDVSKMLYALTMKRLCWVCGSPSSEIAHYDAVGMGRNRKKVDHTKHRFMCLCWKHHQEQHTIGIKTFCDKHHIKPIKLTAESIKELGI